MNASHPPTDDPYQAPYQNFGPTQDPSGQDHFQGYGDATDDQTTWAVVSHLGGLAGALTSVPFGGCIAPLAIWLAQREKGPLVEHHAREALNFQLTVSVVWAAAIFLTIVTLGLGVFLLIPLALVGGLYVLFAAVVAAIAASEGRPAHYAINLNLIKPWRPPHING